MNEELINKAKECGINLDTLIQREIEISKRVNIFEEKVKKEHIVNIVQHKKFLELYLNSHSLGIDIYDYLFSSIINKNILIKDSPINRLYKRIIEFSNTNAEKLGYIKYDKSQNKYIPDPGKLEGDIYEIFKEIFLKSFETHPLMPVCKYIPNNEDDYGVDGLGLSKHDMKLTAIQIKFRNPHNKDYEYLTEEDIRQFALQAILRYETNVNLYNGIRLDSILLITNSKGMHYTTEKEMYLNSISTLDNKILEQICNDGGFAFWEKLSHMIKITLEHELNITKVINTIKN